MLFQDFRRLNLGFKIKRVSDMIFPILQKCSSSVSPTLCMYVKDNRVIFWQRTLVPENSKWYRLSEKHMKRFVVVPRDLTGADSPDVPCGRSSSLPLRPYARFPLCHRTGCCCCSFWCTSSTTATPDKLACCPRANRCWFLFRHCPRMRVARQCVVRALFRRHSVMVWTHNEWTTLSILRSANYVWKVLYHHTTRIDDEMLFLHPSPLPLAPSVAVLSFYLSRPLWLARFANRYTKLFLTLKRKSLRFICFWWWNGFHEMEGTTLIDCRLCVSNRNSLFP